MIKLEDIYNHFKTKTKCPICNEELKFGYSDLDLFDLYCSNYRHFYLINCTKFNYSKFNIEYNGSVYLIDFNIKSMYKITKDKVIKILDKNIPDYIFKSFEAPIINLDRLEIAELFQ